MHALSCVCVIPFGPAQSEFAHTNVYTCTQTHYNAVLTGSEMYVLSFLYGVLRGTLSLVVSKPARSCYHTVLLHSTLHDQPDDDFRAVRLGKLTATKLSVTTFSHTSAGVEYEVVVVVTCS